MKLSKGLINKKLSHLKKILSNYPGTVIAFSGGVDSTLLLKVACDVLGKKVLAVTARSETYPEAELKLAKKIVKRLKCRHIVIKTKELRDRKFRSNPLNRCYFCKLELFKELKKIAQQTNYVVCEASNSSDLDDFRPGLKAIKKLKIESPLIAARFKKQEIRALAKIFKLPNWNKPSMACLASRIPFGTKIDKKRLQRINAAESYLRKSGFKQIRVRDHDPIARLEFTPSDFNKAIKNRKKIIKYLKKLGYRYLTLDLEGYKSGSLNP